MCIFYVLSVEKSRSHEEICFKLEATLASSKPLGVGDITMSKGNLITRRLMRENIVGFHVYIMCTRISQLSIRGADRLLAAAVGPNA